MEKVCNVCGRQFQAKRSDARYCGSSCRVAAHRERVNAGKPKPRRPALPPLFESKLWEVGRNIERLTAMTKDDRFARLKKDLAIGNRNHLTRLIEDLTVVRDALPEQPH